MRTLFNEKYAWTLALHSLAQGHRNCLTLIFLGVFCSLILALQCRGRCALYCLRPITINYKYLFLTIGYDRLIYVMFIFDSSIRGYS